MKSIVVRRSLLALSLVAVIAGCSKEPAAPSTDTAAASAAQTAGALPEGWQRVVGVDVPDIDGATQQMKVRLMDRGNTELWSIVLDPAGMAI